MNASPGDDIIVDDFAAIRLKSTLLISRWLCFLWEPRRLEHQKRRRCPWLHRLDSAAMTAREGVLEGASSTAIVLSNASLVDLYLSDGEDMALE
mmetsp:Transcript_9206/g.16002  ORF Transcript_9206/g.16002 Transcript_9206/m.16002 type:complete len:94 (+) Transcript_9206:1199-1480(+)